MTTGRSVQDGQKILDERRAAAVIVKTDPGPRTETVESVADVVARLAANAPKMAQVERKPEPTVDDPPITLSGEDKAKLRARLGIVRVSDLRSDHMSERVRPRFNHALAAVARYIDKDFPASLMIYSNGYGAGKTTLAKAIQHSRSKVMLAGSDLADANLILARTIKFYTAFEVVQAFDQDGFEVRQLIPNGTKLVILDDVGREGHLRYVSAENQASVLSARYYAVINHCYERRIPLVITTNFEPSKLASLIGGASMSRFLEMTPKEYRLDLSGVPDYRLQSAK